MQCFSDTIGGTHAQRVALQIEEVEAGARIDCGNDIVSCARAEIRQRNLYWLIKTCCKITVLLTILCGSPVLCLALETDALWLAVGVRQGLFKVLKIKASHNKVCFQKSVQKSNRIGSSQITNRMVKITKNHSNNNPVVFLR